MKQADQLKYFIDFFEKVYMSKLLENIRLGKKRITIEFKDLTRSNIELSDDLIDSPEDTLKVAELAIKELDMEAHKDFKVRVRGDIPNSKFRIRDLQAEHLGKFVTIEGTIETKTDKTIKMISTKYECPSCSNIINVLQMGDELVEPTKCGCNRKGKFRLVSKELLNCFSLKLQELPSNLRYGSSLPSKSVLCEWDLAESLIEEKLIEGTKVKINGIFKSKMMMKSGKKQTTLIAYIEANYIQISDETFYDIELNKEDIKEIKEFSKQPELMKQISKGLFQGVYRYESVKEALILQAFGGVSDYESTPKMRGDIHILLVGDPGQNKSVFLEYLNKFLPKCVLVVGKSVSAVGLRGAAVRDELTGSWVLSPGAMPLANGGLICISGSQKIFTGRGLINIEQVKVGDKLISYNKTAIIDKVKKVIPNGKKEVYEVDLYSGDTIVCTADHWLLTQDGWKELRQLTNKDYLKIPINKDYRIDSHKEYEIGWIHGFALSDIWYNKSLRKGSKTCITNSMSWCASVKNIERSRYVMKLLRKHYNIKSICVNQQTNNHIIVNGKLRKYSDSTQHSFSSKLLHHSIRDMFEQNNLPYSSTSFYIGLLAGILSTDSCISHKKGRYGIKHTIDVTLNRYRKSDEINKNIRTMVNSIFHRFGILSTIRGDNIVIPSLDSYNLICKIFKDKLVGKNKSKLYNVIPKTKIKSYDSILDGEYHNWFKGIKFKTPKTVGLGLHSRIWTAIKKNRVTVELMETLRKHWKDITDEEFREPAKNYILNKVRSINYVGVEDVYDLTMETNPNFCLTGGIVHNCIDELDKMKPEDRDIVHEPMEQQSYSPDLELMFPDGSHKKIGEFVDELMSLNEDKIYHGVDCDILRLDKKIDILTTDFSKIFPVSIYNVSRHKSPQKMVEIILTNCKKIEVTPNHPCFVFVDGNITTKPANLLQSGDYFPIPNKPTISWIGIKSIEEINSKSKYVYDVGIRPTHCFISNNMVLHNSVTISLANIPKRKLLTRASFTVSMNPKNGYFNPIDPIYKQIDLPKTLIDRFDLIFTIRKSKDKSEDAKKEEKEKAKVMMTRNKKEKQMVLKEFHNFMRKYIAYARQNINPTMDRYMEEEYLPEKYAGLDIAHRPDVIDGDINEAITTSPRHLFMIKRLAEARRRMLLGEKVKIEDIDFAVKKIKESLKDIAVDTTTGRVDSEWVRDGVPSKKKKMIESFDEICDNIQLDNRDIILDDFYSEAEKLGINPADIEEFLEKKSRVGDIIYPHGKGKGIMHRL